jgi:hypothetical protein
MSPKFRDKIDFVTFANLMEEDGNVVSNLSCLASKIKKKVIKVLKKILSLKKI